MASLVPQPNMNPTRKLSAAVIATAGMELTRFLVQHFAPSFYDAALWAALTPIVVFAVGYFVKDTDNSP